MYTYKIFHIYIYVSISPYFSLSFCFYKRFYLQNFFALFSKEENIVTVAYAAYNLYFIFA